MTPKRKLYVVESPAGAFNVSRMRRRSSSAISVFLQEVWESQDSGLWPRCVEEGYRVVEFEEVVNNEEGEGK